jgi:hypothetical protein
VFEDLAISPRKSTRRPARGFRHHWNKEHSTATKNRAPANAPARFFVFGAFLKNAGLRQVIVRQDQHDDARASDQRWVLGRHVPFAKAFAHRLEIVKHFPAPFLLFCSLCQAVSGRPTVISGGFLPLTNCQLMGIVATTIFWLSKTMSLWCECINCNGDKEDIVCENKLMDMQVEVWKSQRWANRLKIALIVGGAVAQVWWLR